MESSTSPFVIVDGRGYVQWAGPTVEALLGRPAESYVGAHFLDVIDPSSHARAIAAFADFVSPARKSQPWIGPPMQLDLIGADGPVTCEVSAASAASIGGDGAILQVRRWRGTVLLYRAVDAIAAAAPLDEVIRRLLDLLEHDIPASTAVVAVGWDGEAFEEVYSNDPTAAQLVAQVVPAAPWGKALHEDAVTMISSVEELPPPLAEDAARSGFSACWALPVRVRPEHAPSAALVVWRLADPGLLGYLTDTAHRIAGLVGLAVEADHTRQVLREAARTDELTGLSNRADLDERFDLLAATTPDERIAALFCDLDDFKPVNDRLGHDAGDVVLAGVAERIRSVVRPFDVVARWGGDEFVVLCGGPTTADDAISIARRIIDEVHKPMPVGDEHVRLGVSVGIATTLAAYSADLVRRADVALNQAKREGKNVWRIATDETVGS